MIIYQDLISGDEMFSDAFPVKDKGAYFEVDCKMIQVKQGADVDIGANASAEEAGEDLEDGVEIVNDVVYSFRLQSTSFDKKGYMLYIKGYLKAVKAKLIELKGADEAAAFEKEITPVVKTILGNIKDYDFYTGESMNIDGMVGLLNFREDGVTPFFTFFKAGLKEMKVIQALIDNRGSSTIDAATTIITYRYLSYDDNAVRDAADQCQMPSVLVPATREEYQFGGA
ncbi:hypothetical protein DFQ27_003297 [Actinomortierella ambigua]|uniref:Translationally-controlled tumor protein homolog n=1 Tax=Actinomortierella ambigua TaxID=1343610 RepID=A0A9P6Q7Z3_9FUNG|nr:hypothetical protein DFQ27_003297 [Actinomortierella ambigua]